MVIQDNDAAATDVGGILRFVVLLTVGWTLLYTLYRLLMVVASQGLSWKDESAFSFPGIRSDDSSKVCVNVNQVFYPVSYWSEKGGRPYQEDRLDIRHGSLPWDGSNDHSDSNRNNSSNGTSCSSGAADRDIDLRDGLLRDTSLYGVFDGHGGARASQYCQQHLLTRLIELAFPASTDGSSGSCSGNEEDFKSSNSECGDSSSRSGVKSSVQVTAEQVVEATRQAFRCVDESFTALAQGGRGGVWHDGSTAVVAVVHDGQLIVGNAGDSRCILVQRGGRVKAMSDDHKPSREDEERRIKQLGGRVMFWGSWRVEGVLAVSRAIGDVPLKPFITAEPEVLCHDLRRDQDGSSNDLFVVLASDGLFDVMSNEEVAQFITRECQRSEFKYFAQNLCYEAALLGSQDNITVQVIDVRNIDGRKTPGASRSVMSKSSPQPPSPAVTHCR